MTKCRINENDEIINFWADDHTQIPEDALDVDIMPSIKGVGQPENIDWLYKLVDGKAALTEKGEEWTAQEYARNRQAEYPSVQELVVALYDESDKSAIEAKRAAVKLKYPKP